MKLLLHVCCAPCLIYPLKELSSKGFKVSGFFYNPNVYPLSEYQKRVQAVADTFGGVQTLPFRAGKAYAALSISPERSRRTDFSTTCGIEINYCEYLPHEFQDAIKANKDKPDRCIACWRLRLKRTADIARKERFDYFSTTLLVSPYQDQAKLKEIGDEASSTCGVPFYYEDFRPGFRQAHNEAKAIGLYCQKYCGCAPSKEEACRKSEKR